MIRRRRRGPAPPGRACERRGAEADRRLRLVSVVLPGIVEPVGDDDLEHSFVADRQQARLDVATNAPPGFGATQLGKAPLGDGREVDERLA